MISDSHHLGPAIFTSAVGGKLTLARWLHIQFEIYIHTGIHNSFLDEIIYFVAVSNTCFYISYLDICDKALVETGPLIAHSFSSTVFNVVIYVIPVYIWFVESDDWQLLRCSWNMMMSSKVCKECRILALTKNFFFSGWDGYNSTLYDDILYSVNRRIFLWAVQILRQCNGNNRGQKISIYHPWTQTSQLLTCKAMQHKLKAISRHTDQQQLQCRTC